MKSAQQGQHAARNVSRELQRLRRKNERMYVALIGIVRDPERAAEIADAALWPTPNNRDTFREVIGEFTSGDSTEVI